MCFAENPIGFCSAAVFSCSEVVLYYALTRPSRVLHDSCLNGVLHAPMAFFDTIPIGRIISRFSQDMNAVDSHIPAVLVDWLYCLLEVIWVNPSSEFLPFMSYLKKIKSREQ